MPTPPRAARFRPPCGNARRAGGRGRSRRAGAARRPRGRPRDGRSRAPQQARAAGAGGAPPSLARAPPRRRPRKPRHPAAGRPPASCTRSTSSGATGPRRSRSTAPSGWWSAASTRCVHGDTRAARCGAINSSTPRGCSQTPLPAPSGSSRSTTTSSGHPGEAASDRSRSGAPCWASWWTPGQS